MVLKDVFFAEIELEGNTSTDKEFVNKAWYALNIDKVYPDEEITPDGFLDWARDLDWIEQIHIVFVIKGLINNDTKETIEFLDKEWKNNFINAKYPEDKKQVDFIIAGKLI